jgi:hypothetical protein
MSISASYIFAGKGKLLWQSKVMFVGKARRIYTVRWPWSQKLDCPKNVPRLNTQAYFSIALVSKMKKTAVVFVLCKPF